ncbi:hypothetical protein JCM33374_g2875 [Metschnikowia sp. JCM 33374]|nr:hypothetical protein JCM33374_g2875 [Metschnikowia sp. JCM 33374]
MVKERRDPLVISRPFYLDSFDCGYCQCDKPTPEPAARPFPPEANVPQKLTHVTIGCKVQQMTCGDYDDFINMGFRRSGDFLYKGDMLRGCCRMYTIRTSLKQMSILKEHRQVVNRFKRAILEPVDGQAGHAGEAKEAEEAGEAKEARKKTPKHDQNSKFVLSSLIEAEKSSARFHTRFEPAKFSEEKFALYKKYQISVHGDSPEKVTKSSFKNFLCDTPFLDREVNGSAEEWRELNSWVQHWNGATQNEQHHIAGDGPRKRTRQVRRRGPTHECYYLDGKLIAISVLDFLPSGISSVYLIWDPAYAHLSLGTLSGIREVQMCNELGLGYYYLGYYIDDCDKMRYKKKFGGEILDVCNETYVPLDKVRPMMENDNFWVITEEDHEEEEEEEESEEEDEEEEEEDGPAFDHHHSDEEMEEEEECEGEHELTLSGKPRRWTDNIVNVIDDIYGNKETYRVASVAEKILRSQLEYSSSELPAVLPGAIPLGQIVTWLEEHVLDRELPTSVFSMVTGRMPGQQYTSSMDRIIKPVANEAHTKIEAFLPANKLKTE